MPLTILVADDEQEIRLLISNYLESCGYLVITAENGVQALGMVEACQPHLLITDVTMPQMDGYELVQQVRQRPAFRLLPVVFLTVRADMRSRIQGYQLGGDVYLPKPFDLEELMAVVRSLMERSQLIQAEWRWRTQPSEAVAPLGYQNNLTRREQEVLEYLTKGLSNAQIGDRLHLSPRTIEKYVSRLLDKTETKNRTELARFAIQHRLVD